MPRFEPFRGVRYDPLRVDLAQVTAPPYDVIDAAGRRRPGRPPPAQRGGHRPARARPGRAPRTATAQAGAHARPPGWPTASCAATRPSFYVYRMDHPTAPAARATPPACSARSSCRAPARAASCPTSTPRPRPSPTGSTCCGPPGPTSRRCGACRPRPACPSCSTWTRRRPPPGPTDGVEPHAVGASTTPIAWPPSPPRSTAHPVVIADGHHRYETSLAYRDEQRGRAATGDTRAPSRCWPTWSSWSTTSSTCSPSTGWCAACPDGFDLPRRAAGRSSTWPSWIPTARSPDAIPTRPRDWPTRAPSAWSRPEGVWPLRPRPERFAGVRDLDTSRLDAGAGRAARPRADLPARRRPRRLGQVRTGRGPGRRPAAAGHGGPDRARSPTAASACRPRPRSSPPSPAPAWSCACSTSELSAGQPRRASIPRRSPSSSRQASGRGEAVGLERSRQRLVLLAAHLDHQPATRAQPAPGRGDDPPDQRQAVGARRPGPGGGFVSAARRRRAAPVPRSGRRAPPR